MSDYDLIDILRALSMYDWSSILSHLWIVCDVDLHSYGGGGIGIKGLKVLFPETKPDHQKPFVVTTGERLMERSALIHQFESGRFLRLVDDTLQPPLSGNTSLAYEINVFQNSDSDLEIRCDEASAYEVITSDVQIINCLQSCFVNTEILSG